MFTRKPRVTAPTHPDGYQAGLFAPAPLVDVVVYRPSVPDVVRSDGTAVAIRKGRGLANPDGSGAVAMAIGLAAGMAGSPEATLTDGALRAQTVARLRLEHDEVGIDSALDGLGGLRFELRIDADYAHSLGAPMQLFGGVWDLEDDRGSIAREFPRFEPRRGHTASTIELYRDAVPIPLVTMLFAARLAVVRPAHPNRV